MVGTKVVRGSRGPIDGTCRGMSRPFVEEDRVPVTTTPRRSRRGSAGLAVLALLGLIIPAGALAAKPAAPPPVTIQLLNVSDWHGQIDPQILRVAGVDTPVG